MIGVLLGVLLVYAGLCALLFAFQRSLMYLPDRAIAVPADWGVPEFRVITTTTAEGLGIDSWYAPPTDPDRPTIVLFHGNAGHVGYRADKARAFHRAGYGVFLAGYRGYGGNPGQPTEQGLYADARAALDVLVEQGISGQRVVLYGESLGTGVAVQMATERAVAALVLEAPYTSITDVAAGLYPVFPVRALLKDRYNSLGKIQAVRAPLLVVHGERDRIVPTRFGKALFAAAPGPKSALWLPQAGHNDLMAHGLAAGVLAFLDGVESGPVPQATTIDQPARKGTAVIPR